MTATEPLLEPVPPAERSSWRSDVLAVAVLVAVLVTMFVWHPWVHHQPGGHQVTYSVTGSGSANMIDYATAGGSQQVSGARLPWSWSAGLRPIGSVSVLSLIAQNGVTVTGPITCTITVDGTVAASNTSTGVAAVVTCDALMR
jgi:hypothetical protein